MMRYAIYYTPAENEPLTRAAESWLGRSAFAGKDISLPAERADLTASARRYGFHATLKAPFRLANGVTEADLLDAFDRWTAARPAFVGPRLVIDQIDGFFALVPGERHDALDALARNVVLDFEPFRAPLSPEDISRRNPDRLNVVQRVMLETYGYPYVLDEFRFHMTLTDRIPQGRALRMRESLEAHFGHLIEEPVSVASLAIFAEPEAGEPFRVLALRNLASQSIRKTA